MKTAKITISYIKNPDLWNELSDKLDLDEDTFYKYIEYGDYADIEIEVAEDMTITGGRFIPFK